MNIKSITFIIGIQLIFISTLFSQNTIYGQGALPSNGGEFNSAYGTESMHSNDRGDYNCSYGFQNMYHNEDGLYNSSLGYHALFNNYHGNLNTAIGVFSLFNNEVDSNTAIGAYALYTNSSGTQNSAVGSYSLYSNTTGINNVALGNNALYSNTIGYANTSVGVNSLKMNTTGYENVAIGYNSLYNNTTAYANLAIGPNSMYNTTTAYANLAIGSSSMYHNTSGNGNLALGYISLYKNTIGSSNVAIGFTSMYNNISGHSNTGIGYGTLYNNTSGNENFSFGYMSLHKNLTGDKNIGLGVKTLWNNQSGNNNIAIGCYVLENVHSGSFNIGIGHLADITLSGTPTSNVIAIGYNAIVTASNQARIGNSSINSIGGQVGWTTLSDGRFKTNVQNDVLGLKFINMLKPVSYQVDLNAFDKYVGANDTVATLRKEHLVNHTGFIAQEVEAVVKELGFNSFSGVDTPEGENDYYGIRYSEFVVPLVKSVQELSDIVERQQLEIDDLKSELNIRASIEGTVEDMIIELYQNAPNPFTEETMIGMNLPASASNVQVIVYNLEGTQLRAYEVSGRGETSLTIKANDLAAGMYIYALIADNKVISTKRMILTK